jgi:hypothetical protein
MSGRIIIEQSCPVTQTAAAVKSLIEFVSGKPCEELPESFAMPGMMLVLSNKKDVFYVTTPKDCSCPARTYNPGKSCKHMRKHYPQTVRSQSMAAALEPDSIRPTGKWPGGHNGPVSDLLEDMKEQGYEMSFEAED